MGLFKKKSAPVIEDQEVEETLTAADPEPELVPEPDLSAPPAEEPFAPAPEPAPAPMEPEPAPMGDQAVPWGNEGMQTPPPVASEFPPDLEPHLKRDLNRLILVEDQNDRPTKMEREGKVSSTPRNALTEATWKPRHKVSVKELHSQLDRLKPHQPRLVGNWLKGFKTAPILMPRRERVPANILGKKIVFETEGGFVVEVTYRDGTETRKKFFTASSTEGRARALEQIRSGRVATIHEVDEERIQAMRGKGGHLPTPPGVVHTYEISNQYDVLEVEGIGEIFARRLHELGVHTTDQLRLMNATVLANNLGAPIASVEKWQVMSELMIIDGIGKQTAEHLVRAGVKGIDDLKKLTPKSLQERARANKVTGVRAASARGWILKARRLKKSNQPFPEVQA